MGTATPSGKPAPHQRAAVSAVAVLALMASACGTPGPEIVAIEYLRATRTAQSDTAIGLLDIDTIVTRVQREVVLVNTDGDPQAFLRDSVETMLWGLFQETPREEDLVYDATPADVNGDRATVAVTLRSPDGSTQKRSVQLRRTDAGWRVSGATVNDLVTYVIQRLEERY